MHTTAVGEDEPLHALPATVAMARSPRMAARMSASLLPWSVHYSLIGMMWMTGQERPHFWWGWPSHVWRVTAWS